MEEMKFNIEIAKVLDKHFPAKGQGTEREKLRTDLMTDLLMVVNKLPIHNVSESALIDYIENDVEIAIPIDDLMHEEGRHLTKKEYSKVLLKYLVKELRERYC